MSGLLKANALLSRMGNEVSALNCLAYRRSPNNPLRNVNIIILAWMYKQSDVLKFILSDKCKILQHLPIAVGYSADLPKDVDEYHDSAFYDALRSGKWPLEYPSHNSEILYEALSNAYRELKLLNVELPIEMEMSVRNVLFERDFYHDSQTHEPDEQMKTYTNRNTATQNADEQFKTDILKRIVLVLSNISTLTKDFEMIDVDDTFLVIAKFIAKNIHILKTQLRFTYDKIPWEEMEFCLVIFILTETEPTKNYLLHARVLSKGRILVYLNNFASCLYNSLDIINQTKELQKLPISKGPGKNIRESCVLRIIKDNPDLKNLYTDFERVRDEYSLKTMKGYLDLAISVKCDEIGRIVVTRALQVVGENIKNTLESPKLSDITCERLLISLSDNTKKIIIDMRDSISHAESMSKRVEIEKRSEQFFGRIQDDLKKLNTSFVDILCQCKLRIIRDEWKEISECENEERFKEILKSWQYEKVEQEMTESPVLSLLKEMEIKVKILSCKIENKTETAESLFTKISNEIGLEKNRLNKIKKGILKVLHLYNEFFIKCFQTTFENIKHEAKVMINITSPEIESTRLYDIQLLLNAISNYVKSTYDGEELEEQICLLQELYSAVFEFLKINLIEEYKCDITENKCNKKGNKRSKKRNKRKLPNKRQTKLTDDMLSEKMSENKRTVPKKHQTKLAENLLSEKITQLKNVLDNEIFKKNSLFEINRTYQVVVEMLVLDIYSLLDGYMSYNPLFLDADTVTLIGRNLRNHLAHENALINIISPQALIDLELNAKKIAEEYKTIIDENNKRKIGKVFQFDSNKLKFEHEQDLDTLALQEEMCMALSSGDLEIVKSTLREGADIKARYVQHKTALHFASEGTSIETIKLVLDEKCEFDAVDANGQSALHIAARHGRSNIVEYLIENTRIFKDQLDKDCKTPLHIAAEHGHLEVVNILTNSGASTNIQDVHGYSPLHYSVQNNHENIVKALLNLENTVDENDTFRGFTPLHIASYYGHLRLVDYLISKKANVNAKTDTLFVPLHMAVTGGHFEIAKLLIEKGAKVNARYIDGTTALHMVATNGQESILQLLLKHEINVDDTINIFRHSPLALAAENGNLRIIELLLKRGATINIIDSEGETPLHLAAKSGHESVVDLLIKNNASLEIANHIGNTAMHYSAEYGHTSVVKLLINSGNSVNNKNIFGEMPLNLAVENGHLNVTKVLIDNKAYLNNTDNSNLTALHICCKKQFLDIAKLLIESKADIHAQSLEFGVTPFHLALGLGSKAMLEAFEKGGADVEDIKTTDVTALHLGTINGDKEIMQYLIDKNCDVDAKSKSGLTALHLAVKQSNMSGIELLVGKMSNLDVRDNKGYSPLRYAVLGNNTSILNFLIKKGATVQDEGNGEPLRTAVMHGFHDVVTILLATGNFDVNLTVADKNSLLKTSVLLRHKKVAEILLENGADINVRTNNTTPLFSAIRHRDLEMVKLLLKKGADPNNTSLKEEITPLYAAVIEGHTDIVDILIRWGATKVDSTNKSALQLAAECSKVEVIKFLLEYKPEDVHKLINGQFSLMHIAASKNDLSMVKYLVEKGADVNALDKNGRNPFVVAAENGHKEMVEFLHPLSGKNTFICELALDLSLKNGHSEVTEYLIENCVNINFSENYREVSLHTTSNFNQNVNDISTFRAKRKSAFLLYNLKQKSEASKLLQEAYNQQIKKFGKSNSDVLETQTELAIMLHLEENHEEALEHFRTVYEHYVESNEENNLNALAIQADIAVILSKQKKHEEAIKTVRILYESLLHKIIQEEVDPNTLKILSKIAHVYYKEGSYNEAIKLYKKVLDLKKVASVPDGLSVLETLYEIGIVLLSQKKILEAFAVFTKCYKKVLEMFGSIHFLTEKCKRKMEFIKTQFGYLNNEESLCILEQIEEGNTCAEKDMILRVSDIRLNRFRHKMLSSITEEWAKNPREWTRNPEEVFREHSVKENSELSISRAIIVGDDFKGEPLTKFLDKDIFQFMICLKYTYSGTHLKFDEKSDIQI